MDSIKRLLQDLRRNLKTEQRDFLDRVFDVAEKYLKERVTEKASGREPPYQKLKEMERVLKDILEASQRCTRARERYVKAFPEWKRLRQKNVSMLRNIASEINTDRFNCNVSKLVGSSVATAGGITCVVSSILAPFTFGLTVPLAVAGGVATGLGTVTAAGASIAEVARLKNMLSEAQEVVKSDREAFEDIKPWIGSIEHLIEIVDRVIEFDILQNMRNDLKKFKQCGYRLPSDIIPEFEAFVENLLNEIIRGRLFQDTTANTNTLPLWMVEIVPIVICFVIFSISMNSRKMSLLDEVIMSVNQLHVLKACGKLVYSLVVPKYSVVLSTLPMTASKAAAKGIFAGLGVGLNVMDIVFTSIDVDKGSVSEHATEIKETAQKMENELSALEAIYNEL